VSDSSAVAKSRALVERELGGELVGRLDCGCYVYDLAGDDFVTVGGVCELDHADALDLLESARGARGPNVVHEDER